MTEPTQTIEAAPKPATTPPMAHTINAAILPYVPKTLILASDPAVRQGMLWAIRAYGKNLPKGVDENSAVLIMLAAIEYGIDPIIGISKLFMIGGRISPSANTMMELATANGLTIKPLIETAEVWKGEFSRPNRESMTSEYTIEQARQAGLLGSDTWKKHPMYMLRARCISAAIRMYAGDLVKGVEYSAEEVANGSGYFDPNGNFTPDESVVGPNPTATDFKPFEGRVSDNAPAPTTEPEKKPAAKRQTRGKEDVTAQVAEELGKPVQATQAPLEVPATETEAEASPPEPTADPDAPKEAPLTQVLSMLPQGKVIAFAKKDDRFMDFDGTIKNIFDALVDATGSKDEAKKKAGELVKDAGGATARDLEGKVGFLKFYLAADSFCAAAKTQTAPAEIPAFDPMRGARTKSSTSEVVDATPADVKDHDALILDLFAQLAEKNLDDAANKIFEDTGYADENTESPTSVKLLTIEKLQALASENGLNAA